MNSRTLKMAKLAINEISKSHVIRSIFPFMQTWYLANVAGTAEELDFLGGRLSRIIRKNMLWLYAPRKYVGGAILNIIGLQCFRYIAHNIIRSSPKERDDRYKELHVNGVQKINRILSIDDLDELNQFYKKYENAAYNYFDDFSELVILSNTRKNEHFEPGDFRKISDLIFRTLNVDVLYRDITGARLNVVPFVSILHYKSYMGDRYKSQLDQQDVPHTDVFYPSYKLFVYLNDVGEDNGAFMYFPGTHQYKARYAFREYLASLRYYFFERTGVAPTNAFKFRKPSPAISLVGEAGTGVLFNVAGIHRRGNFTKDKYRERLVMLVDYRQQEALSPPREQLLSSVLSGA